MTDGIRGVRSLKWEWGGVENKMAGYVVPTEFFHPFSSQSYFFLRSLNNMSGFFLGSKSNLRPPLTVQCILG